MASRLGSIPFSFWGKSPVAGLIGGAAMALSWGIGSALAGKGFWYPLNVIGTTAPTTGMLGGDFSSVTLAGMHLHLLTSFMWGIIFGVLAGLGLPRFTRSAGRMALVGLLFGLGVYAIMGLIVGPLLNPGVAQINALNYFFGHVVFGVVTGLSLYAMARRRELPITFAPELRTRERTPSVRR